ncbi:heterodisulfide reductase [bacterium]|nr:heterodisulfide reductase [bacterium]
MLVTERTIDREFVERMLEVSGQPFKQCMQCGTCSVVCPMQESTQLTPRQVMHHLQWGQKEALMNTNTPWICASCHTCEVRCPRGIDVPKLMEALRLQILRENKNFVEPFQIDKEQLKEAPQLAFVSSFRKHTS